MISIRKQVTNRQKQHIFVLLFLMPFLLGIGIDLYVPSLPAITNYFHVSAHWVQLTIGFYMLGYAFGQFFLGVLSDSLGRKGIFVIGGGFYILVSFLAALSPNIYILILCRFLQGAAVAGPAVVTRAIASDCFVGLDLSKAFAWISIGWGLGPIVGPFIGGYLQHYFGWQANFYFFGVYSLIIFAYSAFTLPETHLKRTSLHPLKLYHNVKEVVTHPAFLLYGAASSFVYSILVLLNVVAPFLVQIDLHYSVLDYGRIALLFGVAYFIGNFANRFIVHYIKPTKITFVSLVISVLISMLMLGLGLWMKQSLMILVVPVLLIFLVCGLALPNLTTKCISLFPKSAGTASALFGTFLAGGVFILSSLGTFLGTHSQVPLAIMYLALLGISLILFILAQKYK